MCLVSKMPPLLSVPMLKVVDINAFTPVHPHTFLRLMTKRDTFIDKDLMMNIVMNIQVRVRTSSPLDPSSPDDGPVSLSCEPLTPSLPQHG